MRIPINWLNDFVKLPKEESELTDKLTMVGHMLDKKDVVGGEKIIDLELRGNRADCYSILGIAREVSALYRTSVKYPKTLDLKKVKKIEGIDLDIKTPLVKRVMMVKIKDVKITKSPKWLADRLTQYGIDPINNIVDLTNYVMIETGEPMHAFDLDNVGQALQIRLALNDEEITTFHDEVISLTSDDLVWTNESEILSIAGAIGGKKHSINDSTKNVLLEAANYDRANIRRSVHRHNLLTDAGIRHEKELDPNLVETAMGRYLYLIEKNGWGVAEKSVYDYYPKESKRWNIKLNVDKVEKLSGVFIPLPEIKLILKSLNFEISSSGKSELTVSVPTYRTDVTLVEDVIEEILRIYGYDKIPVKVLSLEIPEVVTPPYIKQELMLKTLMTGLGVNEVISSTFVKEKLLDLNVKMDEAVFESVKLTNPPNPDNKVMRMTLLPNLYEFVVKIGNERGTSADLFEIGKIYFKEKGKYFEKRKLGIVAWNKENLTFAEFKGIIDGVFVKSGINHVSYDRTPLGTKLAETFSVSIGADIVGYGGIYQNVYFAELDLDSMLGKGAGYQVTLWPKYPPQIEDHNFVFPEKTKVGEVIDSMKSVDSKISNLELIDVYKDTYTIRVWYQDPEKTLTDSEVEKIRNKMLLTVKEKFGGTIKV